MVNFTRASLVGEPEDSLNPEEKLRQNMIRGSTIVFERRVINLPGAASAGLTSM